MNRAELFGDLLLVAANGIWFVAFFSLEKTALVTIAVAVATPLAIIGLFLRHPR